MYLVSGEHPDRWTRPGYWFYVVGDSYWLLVLHYIGFSFLPFQFASSCFWTCWIGILRSIIFFKSFILIHVILFPSVLPSNFIPKSGHQNWKAFNFSAYCVICKNLTLTWGFVFVTCSLSYIVSRRRRRRRCISSKPLDMLHWLVPYASHVVLVQKPENQNRHPVYT